MHFSAGAPQPTWSPSIPYCQPIQCALSRSSRTSKIREDTYTKYKYKISITYGHENKILHFNFKFSDITESGIKKNENSLTAERWLFSQIKASRPFVGQYICHCILSPIVWIRKSAMYVPYVQLDVHNIAVSVFYCLSSVQCQATAANDWSQGLFLKSRLLFSVETCLRHSKSQHEEK